MLAVCTLRAPYLSAAKHRSQQAYLAGLRRHTCRPAREKASQQARLARHADADPHDDASEHDASRHDAHGARPCAFSQSSHPASGCSILRGAARPPPHAAAVHVGCAWAVHVGCACRESASCNSLRLFMRRQCVRQGFSAAMLVDVLLLVAAAGSFMLH